MTSLLKDQTTQTSVAKKRIDPRNSVNITKKKIGKIQNEIRQYYDKNGYLSWSEKKRKYVILGTNTPVNGLVECPDCHIGKLLIIRSRQTKKRFVGCSNYHNGCRASSPLVQRGMICATKISCKICLWPIIFQRYSRKQKWARQCSNIRCTSRTKS
ncbi:DNA topoisomerase type IA zn finger domain protein [Candidatus Nitrosotalea okcheonensis]|uniref:DNA topoisomerase type IA zn finger domain protein n=1 Tax=Candidatus Nitrosotalea okcheonensis TaxID=1903276 RepID=A0A2H1FGQ3_9ARCH|nr:DNA topoisomerase type IA zn finger domain protein [Candidatus Nitrosotalea okcheonensis]